MPIFYQGQCRLTQSELAKIRRAAANNGHVVDTITTSWEYYLALGKTMDPQTLAEIVAIQAEVLEEFDIPYP